MDHFTGCGSGGGWLCMTAVADFSRSAVFALLRRALSRPRVTAKEQAYPRWVTVDGQWPPLRKYPTARALLLRCALLVVAGTEAWRTAMFSALVAPAMSGSTCWLLFLRSGPNGDTVVAQLLCFADASACASWTTHLATQSS